MFTVVSVLAVGCSVMLSRQAYHLYKTFKGHHSIDDYFKKYGGRK